ncbi:MAG TPA: MFS transporter [Actinomycetota bacterium]|nr:MFS transporter [Actinomycetota bacterium]
MLSARARPSGTTSWVTAELAVAGLSGTVVNTSATVAVAAIADSFDASIALVAAVVVLLNVAMAFTMPLAGAASARFGPRRLISVSGVLVLAASVLLSLSPSLTMVAIARFAQGVALAAVVPVSVQAAGYLLHGDAQAKALGWWGASNGLGLAFAPLIGGAIIDIAGWRWVTVPSCLLGIALVITAFRAFPARFRRDHGIPLRGVVTVAMLTGTTMATLTALSVGAWPLASAAAACCAISVAGAVRLSRPGGTLAAPRLWLRDRATRRSSLGSSLQMVAVGLVQVAVPAWLIVDGGFGAGAAAATVMAMTLTMAALGPITGRRDAVPYERRLRRGLLGCSAGLAGLAVAAAAGSWWPAVPALVMLGIGAGWLLAPSLTAFSRTEAGANAVGMSTLNVLRLGSFGIGGILGGTAVEGGGTAVAFAAVAALCGLAGAWIAFGDIDRTPDDGSMRRRRRRRTR